MKFRIRRRLFGVSAALASLVFAGSAVAQVRTAQPGLQPGQGTPEVQPDQDRSGQEPRQQPGQQPGERGRNQFQPGQQPGATQPGAARPQGNATQSDAQIAAILILDNRTEVEMAQLALQRAQSDDVKRFAQQMIEDHTQFIQKLQPFAGQYAHVVGKPAGGLDGAAAQPNARGPQDPRQPGGNQREQILGGDPGQNPGQPGNDRGVTRQDLGNQDLTGRTGIEHRAPRAGQAQGGQGGLDLVEMKQRVGERIKQSMRSALEEHQGAAFDQAYMGQQLMLHMVMVDGMHVLRDYASPQLQSVLDEGRQTAEDHLEHAKKMKENLAEQSSEASRTARGADGARRE